MAAEKSRRFTIAERVEGLRKTGKTAAALSCRNGNRTTPEPSIIHGLALKRAGLLAAVPGMGKTTFARQRD